MSKTLGIRQVTGTSLLLQNPLQGHPHKFQSWPNMTELSVTLRYLATESHSFKTSVSCWDMTCLTPFPLGRRQRTFMFCASVTSGGLQPDGYTWDEVWMPCVMTCKSTSHCSQNWMSTNPASFATAQRASLPAQMIALDRLVCSSNHTRSCKHSPQTNFVPLHSLQTWSHLGRKTPAPRTR